MPRRRWRRGCLRRSAATVAVAQDLPCGLERPERLGGSQEAPADRDQGHAPFDRAGPGEADRRAGGCGAPIGPALCQAHGAKPTFKFRGRIGGRKLAPGRYRLVAVVARTAPKRASFTIVR
jgi:hypothetical protein